MKRHLSTLVKLLLAVAVFAWMGWQAAKSKSLDSLLSNDKDWFSLAMAVGVIAAALAVQSLRWCILSQALGMKVSIVEALKIGYIAHLGSQFMAGMVVGDGIRVGSLVKRNPGRLHDALVSTFFDRAVGLLGLVVSGATASFLFDLNSLRGKVDDVALERLLWLGWASRAGAVVGAICLATLFVPGVVEWRPWRLLKRLPLVGKFFANLLEAAREYRARPLAVIGALVLTFGLHTLFSGSLHLVAAALPCEAPKPAFAANFTAAMLTLWINAFPTGAFEVVYDSLYRGVADPATPDKHGFVIVLGWRLAQYTVATIGAVLWLTSGETIRPAPIEEPEGPVAEAA